MSTFTASQILQIEEQSQDGLGLHDAIMVTCNVDKEEAAVLARDPEIRRIHEAGRAKGASLVMAGLSEAARQGSASAAATFFKASAIQIENDANVDYEIEVKHGRKGHGSIINVMHLINSFDGCGAVPHE
jgi:hypothetical protein